MPVISPPIERRGRPKKHAPAPIDKNLSEMTPEERAAYDSEKATRYYNKVKKGETGRPRRIRVLDVTQEEAERLHGPGPMVKAVKKTQFIINTETYERMKRVLPHLKDAPLYFDQSELVTQALEKMMDAIEERYNNGAPFGGAPRR